MDGKTTLLTFLIEGPAGGIPGIQQSIIFEASQSEMAEKIRMEAHCPDAGVRIVQPTEWNPPALAEVSQRELSDKFDSILDCMIRYIVEHGIEIEPGDLLDGGTVIMNPVSGRVFLAYRC